ncbi:MAG: hypothetical protein ACRYFR_11255 [Janthinobacterium lividum]
MVKFRADGGKALIYGNNKMDCAWFMLATSIFFTIIILSLALMTRKISYILPEFIIAILTIITAKYTINFSIELTKNSIIIKKTILGISYVKIEIQFDNIFYNNQIHFISFQNQEKKVEVENHEGFKVDYLLISTGSKHQEIKDWGQEIGNKVDADIIFNYILEALDKLRINKIPSDVGYIKRDKISRE